jgi:hypothetical protein
MRTLAAVDPLLLGLSLPATFRESKLTFKLTFKLTVS